MKRERFWYSYPWWSVVADVPGAWREARGDGLSWMGAAKRVARSFTWPPWGIRLDVGFWKGGGE